MCNVLPLPSSPYTENNSHALAPYVIIIRAEGRCMTRADPGFPIPLEHLHRYSYASELLRGRRVLDIAAREGYGARILAETAASVVGLDVDAALIQRAAEKHKRPNLSFVAGSPASLPISQNAAFDGIVGYELIEDSTNVQRLFPEIKRLLTPDGLLVVSAPGPGCAGNLFRSKTFTAEEFRNLLEPFFTHVHVMIQALFANSIIRTDTSGTNNGVPGQKKPQYLMAIASDLALQSFPESICSEPVLALLHDKEKALQGLIDIRAYQDETIRRQERQLADRKQTLASLEEAFAWHKSQIESLTKTRVYLENELAQLRQTMESDRKGLEWRSSQAESLQRTIEARDEALAWRAQQVEDLEYSRETQIQALANHLKNVEVEMSQRIAALIEQLAAIHASTGWKFVLRVRSIRAGLLRLLGRG